MQTEDSVYNEFSRLVGRLSHKLNVLNRDQKVCYGLTMSQCSTIEILAHGGTLTMHELSREMGVKTSTMTRVVDVLVRDGTIIRKNNPEDRRQVFISLTEKGKLLASQLQNCCKAFSQEILHSVPQESRRGILDALRALNSAIDKINHRDIANKF